MELLVLSTLQWRMNPVTPLSFVDYISRRLGFKDHVCWEILRRCERTLLSVILGNKSRKEKRYPHFPFHWWVWKIPRKVTKSLSFIWCFDLTESDFMSFLPSVMATATMLHVFKAMESQLGVEYNSQLLISILGIDKVRLYSSVFAILISTPIDMSNKL